MNLIIGYRVKIFRTLFGMKRKKSYILENTKFCRVLVDPQHLDCSLQTGLLSTVIFYSIASAQPSLSYRSSKCLNACPLQIKTSSKSGQATWTPWILAKTKTKHFYKVEMVIYYSLHVLLVPTTYDKMAQAYVTHMLMFRHKRQTHIDT